MNLPFTTEDFLAVFSAYNAAIWPIQIAAYGFGTAVYPIGQSSCCMGRSSGRR